MAKNIWIVDGRKADEVVLRAVLSQAFAEKRAKLDALRAEAKDQLSETETRARNKEAKKKLRQVEIEARRLDQELKRVGAAVRRQERECRKAIILYAKPHAGGKLSEREIAQMDLLFHPTKLLRQRGDGLSSFHCKFTSRGFGSRRSHGSRNYKLGEAVRHLRYIIRDSARELCGGGLVSNISQDGDELAGFFGALEDLESHDRSNANVYMSLVVSLPHELSPAGRLAALHEIAELLGAQGLPYVGVLHAPDPRGDQRNYHAHLMFSLRPCSVEGGGRYFFSVDKHSDLNDESFIHPFRQQVGQIFNRAMEREGCSRRFTALSNKDRGLSEGSGKSTPGRKHWERKESELVAMQRELALRYSRRSAIMSLEARLTEVEAALSGPDRARTLTQLRDAVSRRITDQLQALAENAKARSARLAEIKAKVEALDARTPASAPASTAARQAGPHLVGSNPVARTQPLDRGSERRRAIADAARRLRHQQMVPIVRTAAGFSVASRSVDRFQAIDRFEGEPLIQRLHERNWVRLLKLVRSEVEGAPRRPSGLFGESPTLDLDFMPVELRSAYLAAVASDDVQRLLRELRDEWLSREREAKTRAARESAAARARREQHIQAVSVKAQQLVRDGRWRAAELQRLEADLDVVHQAVIVGSLVMRLVPGELHVHTGDPTTREAIIRLKQSGIGRTMLEAVGRVTLEETFAPEHQRLPAIALLTPVPKQVQPRPVPPASLKIDRDRGWER